MHRLYVIICAISLAPTQAWYTGPDGKIAVDGTPEHEANRYLKKIFTKYGVDLRTSNEMGEKILAELMSNLGLGVIHKLPNDKEVEKEHDRRRKKRSSEQPTGINVFADSVSSVPHDHENVTSYSNSTDPLAQCRSAPLLLQEYNLDDEVTSDKGIGSYQFGMLCPALLFLTDEKTCITREEEKIPENDPTGVWGYGFLSVTVISLLSFLGVAIVPLISKSFFKSMLSVLVSGAVGALCGDALLHLIPHSQQSSSHEHTKEPIFKNLVVLLGIYLLFVIEGIMKICHVRKHRKKEKTKDGKMNISSSSDEVVKNDMRNSDERVYIAVDGEQKDESDKDCEVQKEHEAHGRHSHAHSHDHNIKGKGVASMAWMVIAGDGMHNFSDGVAIGAAFSASIVGGLSTSIAVFCHELPHELGDFAMLLRAGMTVKQALFYNGFAACLGYLGLILGILIGNYAANVTPWIFAITAGMFLYVALVDMLPEMNAGLHEMKTSAAVATFLLQNVGLLFGIGLMLIISIYEENLDFGE